MATRTQQIPWQIAVLQELERALWDIIEGLESSFYGPDKLHGVELYPALDVVDTCTAGSKAFTPLRIEDRTKFSDVDLAGDPFRRWVSRPMP